eukprot:9466736-Pyramimonas_sp.AAC.1
MAHADRGGPQTEARGACVLAASADRNRGGLREGLRGSGRRLRGAGQRLLRPAAGSSTASS